MKPQKINTASWQLQTAKTQFSQVVDAAMRGEPQVVTRHGKQAVVVIAISEFERYQAHKQIKQPSFIDHLLHPFDLPQDAVNPFDDGSLLERKPDMLALRDLEFRE
jgi:prevent-host-death family protein